MIIRDTLFLEMSPRYASAQEHAVSKDKPKKVDIDSE